MATYVTADLHGYSLEKWERLVARADITPDDRLYVLGDVVDRGADGTALLGWMMSRPFVRLLRGNHEAMMLACEFLFEGDGVSPWDTVGDRKHACFHWLQNGGDTTYTALVAMNAAKRRYLFDYVRRTPLFAEVSVNGRDYVLVHSGLGGFDADKPLHEYAEHDLLWTRPTMLTRYYRDRTVVFGHTPTALYGPDYAGKPIVTDTWINIDVGAASGRAPMILRLDDGCTVFGDT